MCEMIKNGSSTVSAIAADQQAYSAVIATTLLKRVPQVRILPGALIAQKVDMPPFLALRCLDHSRASVIYLWSSS